MAMKSSYTTPWDTIWLRGDTSPRHAASGKTTPTSMTSWLTSHVRSSRGPELVNPICEEIVSAFASQVTGFTVGDEVYPRGVPKRALGLKDSSRFFIPSLFSFPAAYSLTPEIPSILYLVFEVLPIRVGS